MQFQFDDGGRAAAGFKGQANDCVTRSIAIATGKPYKEVYDALNDLAKDERIGKRKRQKSSSRNGVYSKTAKKYLDTLGWKWTPTMFIGSGCKVHLTDHELPNGHLIVCVSKHWTAVIDNVIQDTHDPQRTSVYITCDGDQNAYGSRCVYGYWSKP